MVPDGGLFYFEALSHPVWSKFPLWIRVGVRTAIFGRCRIHSRKIIKHKVFRVAQQLESQIPGPEGLKAEHCY